MRLPSRSVTVTPEDEATKDPALRRERTKRLNWNGTR